MTSKITLSQRTFSSDELSRPETTRASSAFSLRKKSDPEPPKLLSASTPPLLKRNFQKISPPQQPDPDWYLEHLDEFISILPEKAVYEKSLLQKIQLSTRKPHQRLILLRQWIENPGIKELVAPEKKFDQPDGYLELYMLPTPDILAFPLDEASRPFTSGERQCLHFAINNDPIHFQDEDPPEVAMLHFLKRAEQAGWIFRDSDSPEKLAVAILNEQYTQITRLLQAATMNARGDALAFLHLACSQQETTLEQEKDASHHRILKIDYFIHSKDLFTVLHYQPFTIRNKKHQQAQFDLQVAVTYDHGNWKSALYITGIDGDLLPTFKKLHELSHTQRQPRKHPFARKTKPLPNLEHVLIDIQTMYEFPRCLKNVKTIEELYVLNEVFITNRPLRQRISERIPMESMRALKTLSKVKPPELFAFPSKETAATTYLKSEKFFEDIDELLWKKIEEPYQLTCQILSKKVKTYKESDDYFTKTIQVQVTCLKRDKELWSCHMHGAITYRHHQWTVHTLLTNFSIINKMKRLEPLIIEYEKACNPIA